MVVLPPDGPDFGYLFVPMLTFTDDIGIPKVSATVIEIAVLVPVPISCDPPKVSTVPSLCTLSKVVAA